ncbi:beta-N-acetylhexosaminidase [Cnuibacter physcomitrellae]|uniref:beta-N-acetylhexosaminidase n=1 Tax=Cnuibacter physcomitrellae TaxID=1619308 RepID=A0A1X9LWV6_9MICO|nr:glycoside hydrolase family 3 N-terminal domain-containing protein [Cnuibacter physcomitrellae]ARJ06530.1 beta-N-acetylhexosaminidase [Cnuibacter physcomitrellae]
MRTRSTALRSIPTRRRVARRMGLVTAAGAAVLALAGCVAPDPSPGTPTASPTASPTRTPTPTPTPTPVDPIAGMSLEQQVAQLFMVGTAADSVDQTTLDAVSQQQIGGIFLHGRSSAGVDATSQVVQQFTSALPAGAPKLWVSTDQEGGDVQVLSGPGFDDMPSALTQGQSSPDQLRASAAQWGAELGQAGVNMNLAPVADIVTSPETAQSNPPIGELDREYGYSADAVIAGAGAFATGMRDAGVMPTLKHFPGLGHVGENTDTDTGVTDTVVTTDGPDISVYRALLAQGPAVVMLSTATYANIDPSAPAAFSSTIATTLLRDQLGFQGVITTDDLSAAAEVQAWSPGDRATLALSAGVDLLLVSADSSVYPEMYAAVLAKAQADPAFAARVADAARHIVTAKVEPLQ